MQRHVDFFKLWLLCPNNFLEYNCCAVTHLKINIFILEKCDEANLRHLHTVLRQVRDDILQEKVQLLTRPLRLLQETLNQGSASGKSERQ